MTCVADVEGFKCCIQECVQPCIYPLTLYPGPFEELSVIMVSEAANPVHSYCQFVI